MPVVRSQTLQRDLLLTKRDEQIIRAVAAYGVMNTEQIARLIFKLSSLSYVRERLHRLCGGQDFAPRSYLCRFPQPISSPGVKPRLYRVGALGWQLLAREGIPVSGATRPRTQYTYSYLSHALTLNDVVISGSQTPGYRLTELRLCYEIARNPPVVAMPAEPEDEEPATVAVIPDAFAVFARARDGQLFPSCIEVDRSTMPQDRIRTALRCRLRLFTSSAYRQWSGRESGRILYLTDGETKEAANARRRALLRLMSEVLAEEQRQAWATLFRVASRKDCEDLYKPPLLAAPVFYQPGQNNAEPFLTP
jgi:hypothetical protein